MEQLYLYLLIGFFLLVAAGALLLYLLPKVFKTKRSALPYIATPLLTDAERRFFDILEGVIPRYCYLLAQVRLANLVRVRPGSASFWKDFSPIGMKCVDFVVVQRDSMRPLLVVELDDRSHGKTGRRQRDQFVDEVLASVSIPILHWSVTAHYNQGELSKSIAAKLAHKYALSS